MLGFPNAKINIGLNIVSKRKDGYHNLETIFFPVGISDVLELKEDKHTSISCSGIVVDADAGDNLVMKAYQHLNQHYKIPPTHFHLHKIIPYGAGLGGGSSDAAFALKLLNKYYKLGISDLELEGFASAIGADCPFFIKNKPAFAEGIGNHLTEIPLILDEYEILVLKPSFSISTPEAYRGVSPKRPPYNLTYLITLPIHEWKGKIENDFEEPLFQTYPILKEIKDLLYSSGAIYASMSGSGSAMYGIFKQIPEKFLELIPEGVSVYQSI